jgi:hypothetical protein
MANILGEKQKGVGLRRESALASICNDKRISSVCHRNFSRSSLKLPQVRSRTRGHDQRGMAMMMGHLDGHLEDLDRGRMNGGCGDPVVTRDQRSF